MEKEEMSHDSPQVLLSALSAWPRNHLSWTNAVFPIPKVQKTHIKIPEWRLRLGPMLSNQLGSVEDRI